MTNHNLLNSDIRFKLVLNIANKQALVRLVNDWQTHVSDL